MTILGMLLTLSSHQMVVCDCRASFWLQYEMRLRWKLIARSILICVREMWDETSCSEFAYLWIETRRMEIWMLNWMVRLRREVSKLLTLHFIFPYVMDISHVTLKHEQRKLIFTICPTRCDIICEYFSLFSTWRTIILACVNFPTQSTSEYRHHPQSD